MLVLATLLTIALTGVGDPALDDTLSLESADARAVVPVAYTWLRSVSSGDLKLDTALNIALIRAGTPYRWGGDTWTEGVDCSHFTRTIFDTAGTGYARYMTTADLRDLTNANGLVAVPANEMSSGDLLVYGYDDETGWHGHVVVLVDAAFEYGGYRGLVVGSHGGVGVQYLTYKGFPDYWREERVTLRKVLRVVR